MTPRAAKFTISMPEDLLSEVDAVAGAEAGTRSSVIREATIAYLGRRTEEAEAAARRTRVQGAMAIMDEVASSVPDTAPDSLSVLREIRERDGLGHPSRGAADGRG